MNTTIMLCVILPHLPNGDLPPGVHRATWGEIVARFGGTDRRNELLAGLKQGLEALRAAGCQQAYVNGSFVTVKADPQDFDVCWDVAGVDDKRLDPVLLDFNNKRAAQKAKYQGEFFPAHWSADGAGRVFFDFFQSNRDGKPKGIVAIDLGGLP